jgi:hypothetical protein
MIYDFNFQITKDGVAYGTNKSAADFLTEVLENGTSTDKSLLEYRISSELKSTGQTDLSLTERDHLLLVISNLQFDNYFKGELAKPLAASFNSGIPTEVALWRLRSELSIRGLENSVTDAIEGLPETNQQQIVAKKIAKTAWEKANVVMRNSITVSMLQGILGLTSAQVDEIFTNAYLIEA